MEAYLLGVSIRKVDDPVKVLGADAGISKSEVSTAMPRIQLCCCARTFTVIAHPLAATAVMSHAMASSRDGPSSNPLVSAPSMSIRIPP